MLVSFPVCPLGIIRKFLCFSGQTAVTFLNYKKTLVFIMQTKFILHEVEPKLVSGQLRYVSLKS